MLMRARDEGRSLRPAAITLVLIGGSHHGDSRGLPALAERLVLAHP
jgi:hypothetical protein